MVGSGCIFFFFSILRLRENYMVFKCTYLCYCNKNKEEWSPVPTSVRCAQLSEV